MAHYGLDRMYRTHLVAVHATGQDAALARLCSLGDCHRHIPVLSGWHLNTLKIQKVLLAGLQVVDVQRADDFLSLDRFSGIDRSLSSRGIGGGRGLRSRRDDIGGKRRCRPDRSNGCLDQIAALDAILRFIDHARGLS